MDVGPNVHLYTMLVHVSTCYTLQCCYVITFNTLSTYVNTVLYRLQCSVSLRQSGLRFTILTYNTSDTFIYKVAEAGLYAEYYDNKHCYILLLILSLYQTQSWLHAIIFVLIVCMLYLSVKNNVVVLHFQLISSPTEGQCCCLSIIVVLYVDTHQQSYNTDLYRSFATTLHPFIAHSIILQ